MSIVRGTLNCYKDFHFFDTVRWNYNTVHHTHESIHKINESPNSFFP